MVTWICKSTQETEQLASTIATRLQAGDVLALRGEMGAGKTAFVRGLAKGMQVKGDVCSPTYSLINHYTGPLPLIHFDMYRIVGLEDLESTGFFDYLEGDSVLVIEWSENIAPWLPPNAITIIFKKMEENCRKIQLDGDERFETICC